MHAHTEGQKYGRKDEQTLFHRTFPATAGGRIYFHLLSPFYIKNSEYIILKNSPWKIYNKSLGRDENFTNKTGINAK